MPRHKHMVALTIQSMYDAVNVMSEQVSLLHDAARKKTGEEAVEARKYADQIADSVKDIRDSLQQLEARLKRIDDAKQVPPKPH